MFPQRQRGPVKKGVSFDEVCKPRKQFCSPRLNLDAAPILAEEPRVGHCRRATFRDAHGRAGES
jgi:hypothetical protein